eukprot:14358439-Ditylum_brightwellii.AAC.1
MNPIVLDPPTHHGMPSARHSNSLPVEVIHVLCMVPQKRLSIVSFLPLLPKMRCTTSAGCGIIVDDAGEFFGKGKCRMIFGGAIRWGKKLL